MSIGGSDVVPMVALVLLGSLGFLRLMALPAFEDEGSQLRLIWRVIEAEEWLQPLGEGKPLEVWPMVPLVRAGLPPLATVRALHVLAGIIAALVTSRLAIQLSDRPTAWVSGALVAVCPYVVYLQRLALADVFLCAAGMWVLLSGLKLLQCPSWPRSAALACALTLAAACKFPVGFVFLSQTPLALALMPASERRSLLRPPARARLVAAHVPVILLALSVVLVALVRWRRGQAPGFGLQDLIGIGLGDYRIDLPRPNLLDELAIQLSWPVVVLGWIGIAAGALTGDWRQRWLIAVALLPMLAIGLLARFWYPRYVLFTLPPLIIAAVYGWRALTLRAGRFTRPCRIGALTVCAGLMIPQSARIILAPATARWSAVDRYQYFEGPGSGYGYPEAARLVVTAPEAPPTIYALDGHSAYQLGSYLPPAWHARVTPIFYGAHGELLRSEDERWQMLLSHTPAWLIIPEPLLGRYLLANFGAKNAAQITLRQRALFDKPALRTRLAIYEVTRRPGSPMRGAASRGDH